MKFNGGKKEIRGINILKSGKNSLCYEKIKGFPFYFEINIYI